MSPSNLQPVAGAGTVTSSWRETTGLNIKSMRGHAVSFTKGLPSAKKIRNIMHGKQSREEFVTTSDFLATNQIQTNLSGLFDFSNYSIEVIHRFLL